MRRNEVKYCNNLLHFTKKTSLNWNDFLLTLFMNMGYNISETKIVSKTVYDTDYFDHKRSYLIC